MKFKAFNYPINLENVHLIINSWHGPRSSPPNLDQWENVAYALQLALDRQQEEYEELVEEYIASVRLDYLNNFYTDFASRESFTMTYTEAEHHYTL